MHSADPPNEPPTEGEIVPPEEQILPSGGGSMPAPEAQTLPSEGQVQEDEQTQAAPESRGEAAGQAQSLARANPTPIGLAVAFVAGVVVGRIASKR